MRAYSKVAPLGSCDKRCVIDYDEFYDLLNKQAPKLAETLGLPRFRYRGNVFMVIIDFIWDRSFSEYRN